VPSIAAVLHNDGYKDFAESISTNQGRAKFEKTWKELVIKNYQFYNINGTFNKDLSTALQYISILLSYDKIWNGRDEWWWKTLSKIAKPYITALIYAELVEIQKRGISIF
jgi:predicted phosphohydrolase